MNISSLWRQYTTRTDGRTDTGRRPAVPRLRKASRVNK